MSFTWNVRRGVYLQQHKEPALSREIRQFVSPSVSDTVIAHAVGLPLEKVQPEDVIEISRQAAIVDERDGRPLYKKLLRASYKGIRTIVVDALDDEPYISSQIGPLLGLRREMAEGLRAAMRAIGAEQCHIVVYKNISDLDLRIPASLEGFKISRVGGRYPAEARVGQELGLRQTFVTLGVGSLIHLGRAVATGKVQNTCFITVAGNCIGYPTNLEVSQGMNLTQVLERCGLIDNPTRVIIGGPMTGISVIDTDNTVISSTTRAVLAFKEDEKDRHYSCIGCGKCLESCPQGLDPMRIYKCLQHKKYSLLPAEHAQRCEDCGTCSYICPAKLPLSASVSGYGKLLREEEKHNETNPA